jgi:hypothetical protein
MASSNGADGSAGDRAEAHNGQQARQAAWLAAEQRPGGQAFGERVHAQGHRDRRGSGQGDSGSLQETVSRQRRRHTRTAGLLLVVLAAAPGAGGQACRRERANPGQRHQPGPDPRGARLRPCVGEQVQPRDDQQRTCGAREPDLPVPRMAAGQPCPGHGRGRHQAGAGQHRAGHRDRGVRPGAGLDGAHHCMAVH